MERNPMKIWFAWADKLSRETVEPLYKASISVGYDCILEPRGGYDDLSERMKPFSHFVFGVGCDASWNKARESDTKGIFVQHGQYLLGSWRGPWPDIFFLTGKIYADDVRKFNKEKIIYYPGYIRIDEIKKFQTNNNKNIKCLVTLPHLNEHRLSPCLAILEKLRDIGGLICRTNPRNNRAKTEIHDMGIQLDESPSFYDSLARSRCILSGPSNCIIESCILGVPVGVLSLRSKDRHEVVYHRQMINNYESIATLFADIDNIKDWIDHPISKNRKNAKRFWKNDDGDIDVVINSFMRFLGSENVGC